MWRRWREALDFDAISWECQQLLSRRSLLGRFRGGSKEMPTPHESRGSSKWFGAGTSYGFETQRGVAAVSAARLPPGPRGVHRAAGMVSLDARGGLDSFHTDGRCPSLIPRGHVLNAIGGAEPGGLAVVR